ncbi:PDZ domain-containing protein [Candidatus Sumerlaeota bacterium]|nr:PDZ domain-containing protein [Candidatus Sumerlaeota bacterium]
MKSRLFALLLGCLLSAGVGNAQTIINKSMAPALTVESEPDAKSVPVGKAMLGVIPENSFVELPGDRVKSDLHWGAQIKYVYPDSAAAEAGIKEGDMIIGLNGKEIHTAEDLVEQVSKLNVGDKAEVKLLRDEKEEAVTATLKARPDDDDATPQRGSRLNRGQFFAPPQFGAMPNIQDMDAVFEQLRAQMDAMQQIIPDPSQIQRGSTIQSYSFTSSDSQLGIMLQNLTPQLGEFFGAPAGEGALIASIEDDSPAKDAGLKAGDVVTTIDGQKITSPADAQDAVVNFQGKKLAIEVIRDRKPLKLEATLRKNRDAQSGAQSLKM